MPEDNAIDFRVFQAQMAAHTEAYGSFAVALTKILDLVQLHSEKIEAMDQAEGIRFKDLVTHLTETAKYLAENHIASREFIAQLQRSVEEHAASTFASRQEIKEIVIKQSNLLSEGNAQINLANQAISKMADSLKGVPEQITTLYEDRSSKRKALRLFLEYAGAFAVLIGIIESCIQLGLLHLTWGAK